MEDQENGETYTTVVVADISKNDNGELNHNVKYDAATDKYYVESPPQVGSSQENAGKKFPQSSARKDVNEKEENLAEIAS